MIPNPKLSLYYYDSCPFCVMVLRSLENLSVNVELRNTLQNPNHREYLLTNGGKTQVPCLKIETSTDTRWLYESLDIIDYLNSL